MTRRWLGNRLGGLTIFVLRTLLASSGLVRLAATPLALTDDPAAQEVFYFPITPRLRALLRTEQYRKMIQHEYERPSNRNLFSDIYDTPAWREFAGPTTSPIVRMILQFCIDAIPAFAVYTKSLKPVEFINLSLPPGLRGKTEFILLLMLLSSELKNGQKKYDTSISPPSMSSTTSLSTVRLVVVVVVVGHSSTHPSSNILNNPLKTVVNY